MAETKKRKWGPRDYAVAMRQAISIEDLGAMCRDLLRIAQSEGQDITDRLRAMEMLATHLKGRPRQETHICERLDLPRVEDRATALEAYNRILLALAGGKVSQESAEAYAGLVDKAARIAVADDTLKLLERGGQPEWFEDADATVEQQVSRYEQMLRAQRGAQN